MARASNASTLALLAAGTLGLTGVALGAMGAHALKVTLAERGMTVPWDTAAKYHLFHAVALLGVAHVARVESPGAERWVRWIVRCWVVGTLLFSGSLYGIALGGPRWLGPVTPLGGVALMVGWALVIVAALAQSKKPA